MGQLYHADRLQLPSAVDHHDEVRRAEHHLQPMGTRAATLYSRRVKGSKRGAAIVSIAKVSIATVGMAYSVACEKLKASKRRSILIAVVSSHGEFMKKTPFENSACTSLSLAT